jgi:hypothetical protein
VEGHDPVAYARVLDKLVASPGRLAELSRGALAHASRFGWPATADRLIEVYTGAMASAGSVGSIGSIGSIGSVGSVGSVGSPAVVRA